MFDRDQIRKNMLIYTRKAFRIIPPMNEPRILDAGCGTGVPTLELARLSKGFITGVDKSQVSLDILEARIERRNLTGRVNTLKRNLLKMDFPDGCFDIIWSEGSVKFIGFIRALIKWRSILKPEGYHVIHEGLKNVDELVRKIPGLGYKLIDHFKITNKEWWNNYYGPLETYIREFDEAGLHDPKAKKSMKDTRNEINMVKKNPEIAESWFFIMRKIQGKQS